jgi:hypothetical protein
VFLGNVSAAGLIERVEFGHVPGRLRPPQLEELMLPMEGPPANSAA